MSQTDNEFLEAVAKLLPLLNDAEKWQFLAFAEGMAFKADQQRACAASATGQSSA